MFVQEIWQMSTPTFNTGTTADNHPYYGDGNDASSIVNYNRIPDEWK